MKTPHPRRNFLRQQSAMDDRVDDAVRHRAGAVDSKPDALQCLVSDPPLVPDVLIADRGDRLYWPHLLVSVDIYSRLVLGAEIHLYRVDDSVSSPAPSAAPASKPIS